MDKPSSKEPGVLQLVIQMDAQGNVKLEGAINNLFLAYGALELAKDALRRYHEEKNKPVVEPVTLMPVPPLPFGGGRNGRG